MEPTQAQLAIHFIPQSLAPSTCGTVWFFKRHWIALHLFQAISLPPTPHPPQSCYGFQTCSWTCWQALLACRSPADFISTCSPVSRKLFWKHWKAPDKHPQTSRCSWSVTDPMEALARVTGLKDSAPAKTGDPPAHCVSTSTRSHPGVGFVH